MGSFRFLFLAGFSLLVWPCDALPQQMAPVASGSHTVVLHNCAAVPIEVQIGGPNGDAMQGYEIAGGENFAYRMCRGSCRAAIETPDKPVFSIQLLGGKRYLIRADPVSGRWVMIEAGARPSC